MENGVPKRIRTSAFDLKGRCPRPLDDGDSRYRVSASKIFWLKDQGFYVWGTFNGVSTAGGGGPLQRAGGGLCYFGFPILPLRPSKGGHLAVRRSHYFLDTALRRYDDTAPFQKGTLAVGFGFTLFYPHESASGAAYKVVVTDGKPRVRYFPSSFCNGNQQHQNTGQ